MLSAVYRSYLKQASVAKPLVSQVLQTSTVIAPPTFRSFATRPADVPFERSGENASVTLNLLVSGANSKNYHVPIKANIGDTLLETAHKNRINVDGTCDGQLECSTCHCVLGNTEIFQRSTTGGNGVSDVEQDLLSQAFGVQDTSRLSCKVEVTEDMNGMEISFPGIVGHEGVESAQTTIISKPVEVEKPAITPKKFQNMTKSSIPQILREKAFLTDEQILKYQVIAEVLPFRTNNYVIDELIDWSNYESDPIFNLTFPRHHMLQSMDTDGTISSTMSLIEEKVKLLNTKSVKLGNATQKRYVRREIRDLADIIRARLNPHPAKQKEMNVPSRPQDGLAEGEDLQFERGMQHKYQETVLFFPSESQYCHSYCTYCFRWAQFIGSEGLQFASNDLVELMAYLRQNKQVTDLLITGGDPMVLSSEQLRRYLEPIVNDPELSHVTTIRLGSKSLAYWPYKYVTDKDADGMLDLFKYAVDKGKHISFMAHFSHPQELDTPVVTEAVKRIRATGVNIRAQAPLIKNINDDANAWARMWKKQVQLGIIPYYMFVERDTGAKDYFGVPLYRCLEIFNKAYAQCSGLIRTARGPSMSCTPGKVCVLGVETIAGEKVFVLRFLQARNPAWVERIFFAEYDETAKWMNDLRPAFGRDRFFWEEEHDLLEELAMKGRGSSGQIKIDQSILSNSALSS